MLAIIIQYLSVLTILLNVFQPPKNHARTSMNVIVFFFFAKITQCGLSGRVELLLRIRALDRVGGSILGRGKIFIYDHRVRSRAEYVGGILVFMVGSSGLEDNRRTILEVRKIFI